MRSPVLIAALVVAVLGGAVGLRLAQRELDPRYRSFSVTPTLEEAREGGTLVATYRAEPLTDDAPFVEAAYADHPTRLRLGPLLQTEAEPVAAVRVPARLAAEAERRGLRLAFDEGEGVTITADGTVERDGSPNVVPCCSAVRDEAPARFWVERAGERVVAFTRLP